MAFPTPLLACRGKSRLHGSGIADTDQERLLSWSDHLRTEGLTKAQLPLGYRVARVGELAGGTPYVPFTLEAYLEHGGTPTAEPLTLSLTRFDCVTLVEGCLAVSRVAATEQRSTVGNAAVAGLSHLTSGMNSLEAICWPLMPFLSSA